MKKIINYYYLLDSNEMRRIGENYIFRANGQNFIFCSVEQNNINKLMIVLKQIQHIPYLHTLIYNRNNELITSDGNNNYILFRINIKQNRYIKIKDLFYLYNETNIFDNKTPNSFNWIKLWSDKIDYLEYYISLKDNINDNVRCVFNYFIGMGENAVSYLRNVFENTKITDIDKISIVHKRVNYKDTLHDLYNPLNLVFDHISRDISEYLKSLFLDNNYNLNIIEDIIINSNLSEFGYKLLFARMVFPTFFFDLLDKYELKGENIKQLMDIFDKTKKYEKFVLLIYETIKKTRNINIPRISWIGR